MMKTKFVVASISVFACMLIVGCGKELSVNVNGTEVAIPLGDSGVYPQGLAIAQYPGSKVLGKTAGFGAIMGDANSELAKKGKMVLLTSTDAPAKVKSFYEQQLKSAGWTRSDAEMSFQEVSIIQATKNDETIMINIMPDDEGGSNIQLMQHPTK